MPQVLVTESYLQAIGDAIRYKNGSENDYTPYQKDEIEQHIKTAVETYFANNIYVGKKLSVNRLESHILQYLFDERYDIYEVDVEIEPNSSTNIDLETGQIKIEEFERLYPNMVYTTVEYNYEKGVENW